MENKFKNQKLNEIAGVVEGEYLQLKYINGIGETSYTEGVFVSEKVSEIQKILLKNKGFETYSLRHSDEGLNTAEIANKVIVNHLGDFITSTKINLDPEYTQVLDENWSEEVDLSKQIDINQHIKTVGIDNEAKIEEEPEKKTKYKKEFTKEEKETYKKKQYEEKVALLETISNKIDTLKDSDEYKKYLLFSSRFNNYSINNLMLIMSQKPDAQLVASYTTWKKDFDRYVKKGEKAIKIIAPATVVEKVIDPITKEEREDKKVYFHTANVFDVSQTDGKELIQVSKYFKTQATDRDLSDLYEAVKNINKIPVYEVDKDKDRTLKSGALGYYSPTKDEIVISKELNNTEKLSTLVHEMAHSVLHKNNRYNKQFEEVQAESIAFVVLNHFAVENAENSNIKYISSYSTANKNELKESIDIIHSTSNEFIKKIEKTLDKSKENEKELENTKYMEKEEENEK